NSVAQAMQQGKLVVLSTGDGADAPVSEDIVADHAYAVVGYAPTSTTPFTLFNPWGLISRNPQPIVVSFDSASLQENFGKSYSVGSPGAAPVRNVKPAWILDAPVAQPTEPLLEAADNRFENLTMETTKTAGIDSLDPYYVWISGDGESA